MLRESLNQYIKLLENMTNNATAEDDIHSLMKIIGKNNDNLSSAKLLLDNILHLHWWAVPFFWKTLSERLIADGYSISNCIENEEIDRLIHGGPKSKKVDFNLGVKGSCGIKFVVNADYDDYLCVGVMETDIKRGAKKTTRAFFNDYQSIFNLEKNETWPFFKYLEFPNSDGLELSKLNDKLTFNLISEEERLNIVNLAVKQIEELINTYVNYLDENPA